jgi:hypothetical protein
MPSERNEHCFRMITLDIAETLRQKIILKTTEISDETNIGLIQPRRVLV